MSFNVSLHLVEHTAQISMSGELDASSAPAFKQAVERAADLGPQRLVLRMNDLKFMASAGLRVLAFAKQKMGPSVEIMVVGARETVMQTLMLTGFYRSVVFSDGSPSV
jgi:anti-anti-sigma factor